MADYKVETITGVSPYYAKNIIFPDAHVVTVTTSPTGNCQMTSVSTFINFLEQDKPDVEEFIKAYKKVTTKRQIMVDVYQKYTKQIKKLFPNILLSKKYINSTGSKMRIFIIKLW